MSSDGHLRVSVVVLLCGPRLAQTNTPQSFDRSPTHVKVSDTRSVVVIWVGFRICRDENKAMRGSCKDPPGEALVARLLNSSRDPNGREGKHRGDELVRCCPVASTVWLDVSRKVKDEVHPRRLDRREMHVMVWRFVPRPGAGTSIVLDWRLDLAAGDSWCQFWCRGSVLPVAVT